jgi:large conductance mechanosensitive channel
MINYGNFIQATVIYVFIALVLFLVVRTYNRLHQAEAVPEAPPEPSAEEELLTEIRDILRSRPA